MKIKEELQKFFDKKIVSISKNCGYYYVTLDDGFFVKPVYRVKIDGELVEKVGISAIELDRYELIYSRGI